MTNQTTPNGESHWDTLRLALQEQRAYVGNPSYAEIAARVAALRQHRGLDEHAAHVSRSTVYDAFRLGRPRINLELVREIAAAIEVDDATVETWISACHTRHRAVDPLPAHPEETEEQWRPSASAWSLVAVAFGCLALNMFGRSLVDLLYLPFYLDMVGTAVAAMVLGPWRGASVGAATNLLAATTSGWVSVPFAIVNTVGALVWGYGVHRYGFGRSLARFFVLNLAVAATCSLVAVPILVLVFGGSVGQGQDTITQTFSDLGNGLGAAVGLSNLVTSTADKLISGFTALVVISALPPALRQRAKVLPTALN